ncbi:MAG: hypothetical protein J6O61_12025 [Butyrivibrio sp.]|uniref:hypothetical protein n=1 Tax=Butyrivibrio sp. TaxID=28121 RepID=UPI001B28208B|nr:hypothetical protein [Butyrivibrio sp.]MBO6241544.1 hypothetical protein [Butyrivibrio sp.]
MKEYISNLYEVYRGICNNPNSHDFDSLLWETSYDYAKGALSSLNYSSSSSLMKHLDYDAEDMIHDLTIFILGKKNALIKAFHKIHTMLLRNEITEEIAQYKFAKYLHCIKERFIISKYRSVTHEETVQYKDESGNIIAKKERKYNFDNIQSLDDAAFNDGFDECATRLYETTPDKKDCFSYIEVRELVHNSLSRLNPKGQLAFLYAALECKNSEISYLISKLGYARTFNSLVYMMAKSNALNNDQALIDEYYGKYTEDTFLSEMPPAKVISKNLSICRSRLR